MTKLAWGALAKRKFEAGVDRGVFYPKTGLGVAWNGLVAVKESLDGVDQTVTYFDGEKVQNQISLGTFKAVIEALTYPDEFESYAGDYNGTALYERDRRSFNFSYRTLLGDAIEGLERGYKLHLVFNALAAPTSMSQNTIGEDVDTSRFSWDISTAPVKFEYARPSAHVVIDSTKVYSGVMTAIESILYGSEFVAPRFPSSSELLSFFESFSILKIIDNGDGTWTAIGPDDVVSMVDATTFQISWPSVVLLDAVTYTVHSL